jgi:hypothetical protein
MRNQTIEAVSRWVLVIHPVGLDEDFLTFVDDFAERIPMRSTEMAFI